MPLSNVGYTIVAMVIVIFLLLGVYAYEMGYLTKKANIVQNTSKSYDKSLNNIYVEASNESEISKYTSLAGFADVVNSISECPSKVNRGMIFIDHPTKFPCYTKPSRIGRGEYIKNEGGGTKVVSNEPLYFYVVLYENSLIITFTTNYAKKDVIVDLGENVYEVKKYGIVTLKFFSLGQYDLKFFKAGTSINVHSDTFMYDVLVKRDDKGIVVYVGVCPKEFAYVCTTMEKTLGGGWG